MPRIVSHPEAGYLHVERAECAEMGCKPVVQDLTFKELRAANLSQLSRFPGHTSDIDIPETVLGGWSYNDWMVALTGEVGELANLLKKRRRGWVGQGQPDWHPDEAAKELADIQIYLDLLAACLGVSLGEVTRIKFNEVSERAGLPDRL